MPFKYSNRSQIKVTSIEAIHGERNRMNYFGMEIFDGKPLKPILLDENLTLEEQWMHLTQDIMCIDYNINEFEFSIDVGWYPTAEVTPLSYFKTIIIEGSITEGGVFFEKHSKTIKQLKSDLVEAITLIQGIKLMKKKEILNAVIY